MSPHKYYIVLVTLAFSCIAVVFLTFPRSKYSELEKRDLAKFPEYSPEKLRDNSFTKEISSWFSDSEPYRDELMTLSMKVNDAKKFSMRSEEDAVSFLAADDGDANDAQSPASSADEDIPQAAGNPLANENAKIAHSGIIIVGKEPNVRSLMAFGGSANGGGEFVNTVNKYKQEMPEVNVYAMVIPLASEYYTPDKAKKASKPQAPFIESVYARLKGAKGVPAHRELAAHTGEGIYLRTDHHWAPLGAFYAAKSLARTAGVPFKGLEAYDEKTIHNFVGSMYGYSKDISVKKSPENFIYHIPNGVAYNTTYRTYTVNSNYKVTKESAPAPGPFFYKFKDGSGGAYSTFMGSDMKLTKVKTGTNNNRRLLIIKDSYGNAVPGYLFYSFGEVHVVDFRYFTHNMKKYVRDNGITDIAFVVNCFNAYSSSAAKKMAHFLTQGDNSVSPSASEPQQKTKETKPAQKETKHEPDSRPAHDDKTPALPATPENQEQAPADPTPEIIPETSDKQ